MNNNIFVVIFLLFTVGVAIVIAEGLRSKRILRALLRFLVLAVIFCTAALYFANTHPPTAYESPPAWQPAADILGSVAVFAGVMLGIAAQYLFFLEDKAKFHWFDILKTLCVAPILVLPLIGTLQGIENVKLFQLIMLGLLGFQSGFFWRATFERVQAKLTQG